jgi:hypothetical protein
VFGEAVHRRGLAADLRALRIAGIVGAPRTPERPPELANPTKTRKAPPPSKRGRCAGDISVPFDILGANGASRVHFWHRERILAPRNASRHLSSRRRRRDGDRGRQGFRGPATPAPHPLLTDPPAAAQPGLEDHRHAPPHQESDHDNEGHSLSLLVTRITASVGRGVPSGRRPQPSTPGRKLRQLSSAPRGANVTVADVVGQGLATDRCQTSGNLSFYPMQSS